VLALLALALFPVLAHAEQNSGGAVYTPEIPSVESAPSTTTHHSTEKPATHHKTPNSPPAKGSAAKTGGVGTGESETENGSAEGNKASGEGSSNKGEGNPPTGGGGGGNPPNSGGGGGKPEGSISGAKEVPQTQSGTNASHSGGGGSSPVVPILIAVAVLAAISIGVVLYRQRKSQGGSDGRVSSSNAS
jgi:cobalamin biosynthesis Mg chelatase CobN